MFSTQTQFDISPVEAHQRQQPGALLVDVREPHEWATGHAAGARHIPLGSLAARQADLPTDSDMLFICAGGNRSVQATEAFRRAGYQRVYNVRGGTPAWIAAGLPISR